MINFGDVPTWVAAIGTVGTLGAALLQIGSERSRRLSQEAADREERRRDQARLIAGWVGPIEQETEDSGPHTWIILSNGSPEPVYGVYAAIVFIQGAAPHTGEEWHRLQEQGQESGEYPQYRSTTTASILPPGRWRVRVPQAAWGITGGRIGAEVAFTDRASVHWVRRATGTLEELATRPFDHFDLTGPYELQTPEAVDS
jgi:hypothetical protein